MPTKLTPEELYFPAAQLAPGYNPICGPENSPLRWMRFGRLWLPTPNGQWTHEAGQDEQVLALLHGSGTIEVERGPSFTTGPRRDPFAAPPTLVCLPPGSKYRVRAGPAGLDMVVTAAPAGAGREPRLMPPAQAAHVQHGASRWARRVYLGTTADDSTQRLMVGETFNRPGGWTSYPPHKHDEAAGQAEQPYEELYFFLMKPAAGFAFQRVYDPPGRENAIDFSFVVHDGDTVVVPRGYHPVAGGPGYQMYYLWAMCGEEGQRTYGQAQVDPQHAWLAAIEPLLEEG